MVVNVTATWLRSCQVTKRLMQLAMWSTFTLKLGTLVFLQTAICVHWWRRISKYRWKLPTLLNAKTITFVPQIANLNGYIDKKIPHRCEIAVSSILNFPQTIDFFPSIESEKYRELQGFSSFSEGHCWHRVTMSLQKRVSRLNPCDIIYDDDNDDKYEDKRSWTYSDINKWMEMINFFIFPMILYMIEG